ncbi:WXG100 family type VII secretion target [Bifidobacterium sp. ESL0784]|uniref:WXG100 family type VII secretion target n=1 Tax=Bifidobacterium sp. ESL0784 TaxID=2983231 RepID=UPI0023F90A3A|nr:WXG100 family type VII secretion target [Bifidobacterium sp. ESL0784]MDF7641253.1 WXG100 family type VII secretion target [Bifidobacterium sp. ESL0784]
MAGQIRITPEDMHAQAGNYRKEADNVNNVIHNMDTLLHTLMGEWEGAASRSYNDRYQQLKPGFIQARDLINEIAAALDKTANTLSDTDNAIANGFRG